MTNPHGHQRLARRLLQLYGGLLLYGISMAMILRSTLGNMPWDVLHEGLALRSGVPIGGWVVIVAMFVLLLWIPLRIRPGLGTVSNVIVLGIVLDAALALSEPPDDLPARVALVVAGVLINAIATGMYIGAHFGPGPRDGLMTGLAARGGSIRVVRTAIEVSVVAAGALLGGTVGVGTLAYALAIGPLVHVMIPYFDVPPHGPGRLRDGT